MDPYNMLVLGERKAWATVSHICHTEGASLDILSHSWRGISQNGSWGTKSVAKKSEKDEESEVSGETLPRNKNGEGSRIECVVCQKEAKDGINRTDDRSPYVSLEDNFMKAH